MHFLHFSPSMFHKQTIPLSKGGLKVEFKQKHCSTNLNVRRGEVVKWETWHDSIKEGMHHLVHPFVVYSVLI